MKKKQLLFVVCLTAILYSCSKTDNEPVPESEPKIVEDTVQWPFDDCLDSSVTPGSGFYDYAGAGYIKKYGRGTIDEQGELSDKFVSQAMQAPAKPQLQTLNLLNTFSLDVVIGSERAMLADYFSRADTMDTKNLLLLLMERTLCSECSAFAFTADCAERKGRVYVTLNDGCGIISEAHSSGLAEFSGYPVTYISKMIQDSKTISAIISQCNGGTKAGKFGMRYTPSTEEGSIFAPMNASGTKGSVLTESQKLLCNGFGLEEWEYEHLYNWEGWLDNSLAFIDFILENDSPENRDYLASYTKLCKLTASFNTVSYTAIHGNFNDLLTSKRFVKSLLSNQFIEENITEDHISNCAELAENFRSAFESRIDSLEWMSPTTKKCAKEKIQKMHFWYGIPSSSLSEFEISVSESDLQGAPSECFARLEKTFYDKVLKTYIKSDALSDDMLYAFSAESAPSYWANAFYSRQSNSMCIMASNLVSPISRNDVSAAYNYAVIGGTTIGHEMCHGFDAEGAKFDAMGAKANWWTVSDALKFKEKQNQLAAIFNQYEINGTYDDGNYTITENMADLGGIVTGFDALVRLRKKQGFDDEGIREQMRRYFISWAIAWTNSAAYTFKTGDVHSPGSIRTNGQVNLIDEWYDIFDVKWGDKYYLEPEQRVKIW